MRVAIDRVARAFPGFYFGRFDIRTSSLADFQRAWRRALGPDWSGVVELIASLLLLVPRTVVFGAILTLGTISGAIFAHLTKLRLTIPAVDDHGELFGLAIAILACTVGVLYLHRSQIPFLGPRLFSYSN